MMTLNQLRSGGRIAIVGAGPGGLMLARILQTRGVPVTVYERDASATSRSQGGSLDLRPDTGQHAIRAAGLVDAFEKASRSDAKSFKLMDSQGQPIPAGGEETHEDAGPEIDRGDLRQLLLDSLEPDTVVWGHAVQAVTPEADGRWRIAFDSRDPTVADLIVGADGIGSKVRERLTTERPRYVGHTMLAANLRKELWRGSKIADLVGEGSVMFAGGNKTIFVQRLAGDVILIYVSLAVAEDWPVQAGFELDNHDAVLAAIEIAYADWSPEVLAMLTDIEGRFQKWPLSVLSPDIRWQNQPGLTMLGDAAHVMPPFTGKGVNLALFDALDLADSLTGDPAGELSDAVGGFERRMQARTRVETGACLEVGLNFYGIDLSDTACKAA